MTPILRNLLICQVTNLINKAKGAHWAARGSHIQVAMNPKPAKSPCPYAHPSKYVSYVLNPDLKTGEECVALLAAAGFDASANTTFDWIHDTFLILIRMFPGGCPPTTIISSNARWDPHYHVAVGAALRPLRLDGKTLFVGTGGAVHNLYRNHWGQMLVYRDSLAQPVPPAAWAMAFRQEVEDAMKIGGGPELRRRLTRLMKHPGFRDAHPTDDHFMPALFVAGVCGDEEDRAAKGCLGVETWELVNMCNSQFMIGEWPRMGSVVQVA